MFQQMSQTSAPVDLEGLIIDPQHTRIGVYHRPRHNPHICGDRGKSRAQANSGGKGS